MLTSNFRMIVEYVRNWTQIQNTIKAPDFLKQVTDSVKT